METNKDIVSVSSSATLSCMKDSNDVTMDVEVEERAERAEGRISLRLCYDWLIPKFENILVGIGNLQSFEVFFLKFLLMLSVCIFFNFFFFEP